MYETLQIGYWHRDFATTRGAKCTCLYDQSRRLGERKKMYQMKIAARKRIFIKESATLPVGLSNEQEVTVRVDGLL
jgi:hypothetical protein